MRRKDAIDCLRGRQPLRDAEAQGIIKPCCRAGRRQTYYRGDDVRFIRALILAGKYDTRSQPKFSV